MSVFGSVGAGAGFAPAPPLGDYSRPGRPGSRRITRLVDHAIRERRPTDDVEMGIYLSLGLVGSCGVLVDFRT